MNTFNDDYMIGTINNKMSGEKLDNVVKWVETIGDKLPPFTISTKKGSFSFGDGQVTTNPLPIAQKDSTNSIIPYKQSEQWYQSPIVLIGGAVALMSIIVLMNRR